MAGSRFRFRLPFGPRVFTLSRPALRLMAVTASLGLVAAQPVQCTAVAAVTLEELLEVTLTLPEGVPLTGVAVAGDEAVDVGNNSEVSGSTSTLSGDVTLGAHTHVGPTTSGGDVQIETRAAVEGDVVAAGYVDAKKNVSVSGDVTEGASLGAPLVFSWKADEPAIAQGDVELAPGELRDLEPSVYGVLDAQPDAQVVLHTGVYVFDDVEISPDASLIIEDSEGPVQVYVRGTFDFKGNIESAYVDIPQLLVSVYGGEDVVIHSAFTGVLIAQNADVRVGSGHPDVHRASIYGRSVHIKPNALIRHYAFEWDELVAIDEYESPDGRVPRHDMPNSPGGLNVNVDSDGNVSGGGPREVEVPIDFTLPGSYPVAGGIIGNGTVIFKFWTPDGTMVTCTYQGASPTAEPATADDLNLGRLLEFVSCSDGLPADAPRSGVKFDMMVNPAPGYFVTVRSPMQADGSCSDEMELLSAYETRTMRRNFDWDDQEKVAEFNPGGTHALYYAWVYIRDVSEAAALRQLYIHILNAPLFTEELAAYAGRCGLFTNPGDGEGAFIPVVIPGITYNRLIDALESDDIDGDRVVFDAVILRDPPSAARNSNGSIRLDVLAKSGFRYLHYERHPLPGPDRLDLSGGASKLFVDVLTFVGEGLRDVGEAITNTLARLDRLFRDGVEITLHMHAVTDDKDFTSRQGLYCTGSGEPHACCTGPAMDDDTAPCNLDDTPAMIRGWGRYAGRELAAYGAEVTILQDLFDLPIPTTSQGHTDMTGRTVIEAVKDGDARGSGLCIELKSRAARLGTFLLSTKLCDLRGFDPERVTASEDFQLDDFSEPKEIDVHIANYSVVSFYQADDVFRYGQKVQSFSPRRARILYGYWAETFSSKKADGSGRPYAPCLGYPNTVTDAMVTASLSVGLLSGLFPPAAALSAALATFTSIIGDTDVVMPLSAIEDSREVGSHEYGHFMLCAAMFDANPLAVDHLVWTIIAAGDDQSVPTRYLHEATADYYTGQVLGGANYNWLDNTRGIFCDGRQEPVTGDTLACWDKNFNSSPGGDSASADGIARVASMMHDAFDGQGGGKRSSLPGDGDTHTSLTQASLCTEAGVPWSCCTAASEGDGTAPCTTFLRLQYTRDKYGDLDSDLEPVAVRGRAIKEMAAVFAAGLLPVTLGLDIDDEKINKGVDRGMSSEGVNWCDRCRVLALHSPFIVGGGDTIRDLWETCEADPDIANAMAPAPDPDLRLAAATCTTCPDGYVSDDDGVCIVCNDTVVGNECYGIPPVD